MSALCPVARSVGGRSAVAGSQLGRSGRYYRQRLGLALFDSSSRLLVWLGQGHLVCSICMPRDVPHVRLGGVQATQLHASGTTDSQLLLYMRGSGDSLLFVFFAPLARLALSRYSCILTDTYIHTAVIVLASRRRTLACYKYNSFTTPPPFPPPLPLKTDLGLGRYLKLRPQNSFGKVVSVGLLVEKYISTADEKN